MPATNPWKSYRQIATQTAPPGQLILMLFDGAVRFLERGLTGFDCTDPAEANMTIHNNFQRAQDIVRELNRALNLEQGGECAETFRQLYDYFDRKISESNVKKRPEGATGNHHTSHRLARSLGGDAGQSRQSGHSARAGRRPRRHARPPPEDYHERRARVATQLPGMAAARRSRGRGHSCRQLDAGLRLPECSAPVQPRIVRQTQAARREWSVLGLDFEAKESGLSAMIHSLIELEQRNHSLIDARQRLAREELSKLELASLTLRRIQRSYTPMNPPAWASFS